ncbi:hypothetical protein MA16_Dca023487 [Dendrobium catenatum]|uniref:Uncharacterized protein n=1 Tax=Dendrobium catenatum TaxID=906689 RepID=A0A2I0WQH4_9ASPA|nr:hypothetical protein MA16_Dca023487 [Dendrobium catenatum]
MMSKAIPLSCHGWPSRQPGLDYILMLAAGGSVKAFSPMLLQRLALDIRQPDPPAWLFSGALHQSYDVFGAMVYFISESL